MGFRTISMNSEYSTSQTVAFHLILGLAFLSVLLMIFTPNRSQPRGARKKSPITRNAQDVQTLRQSIVDPPGLFWTLKMAERPQSLSFARIQALATKGRHTLSVRRHSTTTRFLTASNAATSVDVPTIQEQLLTLANESLQLSLSYEQSSSQKCWAHFVTQFIVLISASTSAAGAVGYLLNVGEQTMALVLPLVTVSADGIDNLLTLEKDCTIEYNLAIDLQRLHDRIYAQLAPGAPSVDLFQFYQDCLDQYDQLLLDNSLSA